MVLPVNMKKLISILIGTRVLFIPTASAACFVPAADPCRLIGGCVCRNDVFNAIPLIVDTLVAVAAGVSIMFIIVGAYQLLISAGEEGAIGKGKMSIIFALVGLGITMVSQTIVAFAIAQFGGLQTSGDPIFAFMGLAVRAMTGTFNAVFVIMMIFGGFKMAFARGNADEFSKARGILIWACVGAICVNVARALVNAVMNLPI